MLDGGTMQFRRRTVGWILTPLAFFVVWFGPFDLDASAQRLAAIFVAVIVAWVTELVPISVTALLIAPAMIAAGVTDKKSAFAPYADPIIFLFIGGFFIARAMQRHGLDRRIAHAVMSFGPVRGSAFRIRVAFMGTGLLLSMWISNTATAAILIPIFLGTLPEDDENSAGSLLTIAYACSVGGLGTLVGSPPNSITVRLLQEQAGIEVDFVEWMGLGLTAAIVLLIAIAVTMQFRAPLPRLESDVHYVATPWSRGERVTAFCFCLAVAGWMIPGLMHAMHAPQAEAVVKALPIGAVAIFASAPLFLLLEQDGETPVLPWSDAVRIDWGLILLFGGGLSLGAQMFETGLANEIGHWFLAASGIDSLWGLTTALIVFTIFFTEACSNTASATMLVPLAIAASTELGVSPLPPSLAVGLAASCAFMLPIATGPNAVVFGTGKVPLPAMIRTGFVLNIVAALTLLAVLRIFGLAFAWD